MTDPPQLLVLAKLPKPVNEMTDEDRSAFAATFVAAMYREHDRSLRRALDTAWEVKT